MKPRLPALLIVTEDAPESYSPAGERIQHLALASGLRFRKVVVLALRPKKSQPTKKASKTPVLLYTINFSRALPFPFTGFFDPVKMLMLLVHGLIISRRIRASHVIASMPPLEAGTSSWLLSKFLRLKLVIDLRDDWESSVDTQLKRYFPKLLISSLSSVAKQIYSSAIAMWTVTQTIGDTVRRRGIQTKILFVPNGADTSVFQPQPKEIQAKTRMEYALPLNKIITVYSGSGLNPYYRLDLVLSSISLLRKETFEKHFFVFYVYNGYRYLNELKRQMEIPDNLAEIRNPLPRNELARVLSACDIGLVPFDAKPYLSCARSTKMYEYLSSGLYVISSGPSGGELDFFFSQNHELGLFTLPSASKFAHALLQVAERAESLLGDGPRESRYGFIRRNYDRQGMMRKAIDTLAIA